jgi:L,D-transpeptidase catalytic domain
MAALSHLDEDAGGPHTQSSDAQITGRRCAKSPGGELEGQMRLSAFLRYCRFISVAALGAMLAFSASAQTGSESQTPSIATPGSESQTPSTATPGSESQTPSTATPGAGAESKSPGAPTSSNPAVPEANSSTTIQPRKAAVPDILIVVSKPTQSMTVTVDGHVRYRWRVSTGATHYSTPAGSYTPFRMELMHYSREFDNAGMPHAIFFTQRGHSIHGSDHPGLWHRSVSWVRSSYTFKRNDSLSTRQVGRHGEDEGCRQWT